MEAYLEIAQGAIDLSKQRELMSWTETSIVNIGRHADDIDLTHESRQLCDRSGFTQAEKALQQCGVSWAASSPFLVRLQEGDEVQIAATQLVDESCQEGTHMLLIHVCQCCAETAVVAIAHAFGCLRQHKIQ